MNDTRDQSERFLRRLYFLEPAIAHQLISCRLMTIMGVIAMRLKLNTQNNEVKSM